MVLPKKTTHNMICRAKQVLTLYSHYLQLKGLIKFKLGLCDLFMYSSAVNSCLIPPLFPGEQAIRTCKKIRSSVILKLDRDMYIVHRLIHFKYFGWEVSNAFMKSISHTKCGLSTDRISSGWFKKSFWYLSKEVLHNRILGPERGWTVHRLIQILRLRSVKSLY